MTIKVLPFDPASVTHVLQRPQVDDLLRALDASCGVIVADLETTSVNEHWAYARVVTLAVTIPHLDLDGQEMAYPHTYVVGLSHPDAPMHRVWRDVLRQIVFRIRRNGIRLIGHNIKFDIRWLTAITGVDLTDLILRDTGLSSHLLDENSAAALKSRAMATFGIEKWIDFDWNVLELQQLKDPRYPHCPLLAERVDYFTMALYNARDTYWTWRLDQHHCNELGLTPGAQEDLLAMGDRDSTNALRLGQYYQRVGMNSVRTLTGIEQFGMQLDRPWCDERLALLDKTATEAHERLNEMYLEQTGLTAHEACKASDMLLSYEPTALWFKHWAKVMCDAGLLRVLGLTGTGEASWTKEILARLDRMGFAAAQVLSAYRKSTKEAQFIRSWFERTGTDDRIHPTYNYFRVVTGRLSSSDPNAQQIPKTAKNAFTASPGSLLVTADYSQIELRVAAHMAKCQPMIDAFNRGEDLHRTMAALMAGIDPSEVTPEQRQKAKAANFGFLFGMGAEKFVKYAEDMYGVTFTEEEAVEIRDAFFSTWDGMAQWHQKQERDAQQWGYVRSPLGRLRRLPAIWSGDGYRRSEAARQAINSPTQAIASDTMLLAASLIARRDYLRPVALVHDAVLVEVPEARAQECAREIKELMERGVLPELAILGCDLLVPLVSDVAIGRNWADCELLSVQ